MTMTYEPFTPAGSDEQRRYDGRRRAQGQPEAPQPEQRGEQRWSDPVPADPWAESAHGDWSEPAPRAGAWSEPAPRAGAWSEPAPQQRAGGWSEPAQEWAAPASPRVQHWGGDQQWEPAAPIPRQQRHTGEQAHAGEQRHTGEQPRHTGEQTAWHTGLTPATENSAFERSASPAYEKTEVPAYEKTGRTGGSKLKPAIVGVVTLLLLVAGWQAYRIEGMSRHNQDLASVLSAEQSRTDQLEKKLAGVFDPEAVSSGVLPSVFRVRAGGFTGTAFSVGKKATGNQANLITNYHVVAETWTDGGRKVSLERGSTRISATIVKVDKGKDLALLKANQKIPALGTSTNQVKPGQQVVVVGAPLGLDDSVTTGVISAYRPNDADGPTVQFDAPINPGNSGGPVVNANEQVVGVATAKAKDAEGIGLAIPIKTACETLKVC
ncbi:trypsin-like peptidase domain-containing protein [Actinoplanes sp. TRM 88003]|uniref:Trypsin-like peptidase domain-containing protein n=1 Tax=Paractinoplanes aksuensis TaxID=2939490 RepID=A0ABT1DLD3_9ACTN|nr:trypsin-like peptidase domain-containing protein [Actinoplanes aksuensis]MCO8270876.1 trypsin-like peptidase domain-containing protein [Actinoplanes aksuensis]